jgi:predicted aldo/keto reductase-like oxidoreductase
MLYRTDRKTGNQISQLGYGAMRLPVNSDGTINEKEAIACIRHAIDEGVNYVDTAYMYHNGTSEAVVGKALKDGYREKTNLASKLPIAMIFAGTAGTKEEVFAEQLRRLDTDYIDFYLAHDINYHVREKFESEKIYDYLAALKA